MTDKKKQVDMKMCPVCNRCFDVSDRRRKYCSAECRRRAISARNNQWNKRARAERAERQQARDERLIELTLDVADMEGVSREEQKQIVLEKMSSIRYD